MFLGRPLPRYAVAAIDLAQRYSGVSVNLIGENNLGGSLTNQNLNFIPLEDFYSQEQFIESAKRVTYSASFRDGFWLKSLERIFVLEQFMAVSKKNSIFHAELDQILFRVDCLIQSLELTKHRGLFVPFQNSHNAVASVLFCNDLSSLSSVTAMASGGDVFPNEMALIARWAGHHPERAFALPTPADLYASRRGELLRGLNTLSLDETGGLVDAAQLGQWVAGIDPRNVPIRERPQTKFVDPSAGDLLTRDQLNQMRVGFDKSSSRLFVQQGGNQEVPLFNLHLHSKIHPWLQRGEGNIATLFSGVSNSVALTIPGTRRVQLFSFFLPRWKAFMTRPHRLFTRWIPRLNSLFGLRPSSYPFVSGDGFRKLAHHVWEHGKTKIEPNRVQAGDIIFCEADELPNFERLCLPRITKPFVLLLGNSDVNHSLNSLRGITGGGSISVFAQNLTDSVPNVQILPIGLENAWRANHGWREAFWMRRLASKTRLPRIMWSFNFETNPSARAACANALVRTSVSDSLGSLSPSGHRKALSRYSFVASPPGNGLDTHRMWEALYLGCVPIVVRSHLTEQCGLLGLPVWIVEDYGELEGLTESDLEKLAEYFRGSFNNSALWHKFWERRITDESRRLGST